MPDPFLKMTGISKVYPGIFRNGSGIGRLCRLVLQDCKTRRTGRLGDNAGLFAPRRQPPLMRDFNSASNASTLDLSIILVGTMISLFSGTTDLSPSRYFAISFMPW